MFFLFAFLSQQDEWYNLNPINNYSKREFKSKPMWLWGSYPHSKRVSYKGPHCVTIKQGIVPHSHDVRGSFNVGVCQDSILSLFHTKLLGVFILFSKISMLLGVKDNPTIEFHNNIPFLFLNPFNSF